MQKSPLSRYALVTRISTGSRFEQSYYYRTCFLGSGRMMIKRIIMVRSCAFVAQNIYLTILYIRLGFHNGIFRFSQIVFVSPGL